MLFRSEFAGNFGDISKCRKFEELPKAAQEYVNFVGDYTGAFVKLVGVGADREEMIIREK